MRPLFTTLFILALLSAGVFALWLLTAPPMPTRPMDGITGDATRGMYAMRTAGCVGCHTRTGGAMMAGGAPIVTDFGTFIAPNITPHPTDGIGTWQRADLVRALSHGISPSGSLYYPVFPYPSYTGLTGQDMADIWSALQALDAVDGGRTDHSLFFPFNIRSTLRVWRRAFFSPALGGAMTDNRGQYLLENAGHCGACHSPRTLLGSIDKARALQGGRGPNNSSVPAITPDALEKNGWQQDDIAFFLKTGLMPDGDSAGSSMAEVVEQGTSHWNDADLQAIAAYLLPREAPHDNR